MLAADDPLILDLVEWVAREERSHADLMESWRTSCPRLTVWEDAVEHNYLTRQGRLIAVTPKGRELLSTCGRRAASATRPTPPPARH